MTIAYEPYKANIPFVNVQQMTLQNDTNNRLMVELIISNETSAPRDGMKFGNLVTFFTSKAAINSLSSNQRSLKNTILRPSPTSQKQDFSLNAKDFDLKVYADRAGREKIYNHTNRNQFSMNAPNNLYVLVVSYRRYKNKIFLGNVMKETIIENGITPLHSKVYLLKETVDAYGPAGAVWPGSVHEHGGELMAGNIHLPMKHPTVSTEIVQNYKVKDLRFLQSAATLNFDNFVAPSNTVSIFSKSTLSRNDEGDIHGTLSFDMLKYARQNSRFGGLIKNNATLLSMSVLEDIILYRKVVDIASTGNKLTPGFSRQCGLKESDEFQQVAVLGEGVDILRISASRNTGIISISFVDEKTKELAAGAVEYKIEMVINDRTTQGIKYVRDSLLMGLKSYRPSTRSSFAPIITTYLSIINFIFGTLPFTKHSLVVWKKNLLAMTKSPYTRKTDRQMVIETIHSFIGSLSSLLETPVGGSSAPFSVDSKIYNSSRDPLTRIVHILENKYTIADKKRVGLGYLDKVLGNKKSTMPTVASSDLLNRANKEVSKYSVGNPTAVSINKFGYLSPEVISLGEVEIETPNLNVSEEHLTDLLRSNAEGRNFLAVELQKSAPLNRSEILSSLGMSARPLTIPLRTLSATTSESHIIDSSFYLSPTSRFVRDRGSTAAGTSGSSDSIIIKDQQLNALFNSDLVSTIVDRSTVDFKEDIDLKNKAIVSTSLALRKFEEGGTAVNELNSISNVINFNSLARIEYLESYDNKLRCGKLNWKILDEATWQSATTNDRPLLCRLVQITNTLDVKDTLGLESLGSLFTLGVAERSTATPNYKKVLATIRSSIAELGKNNSPAPINIAIYYSKNVPLATTTSRQTSAQKKNIPPALVNWNARRGRGY